jgi:hypothetical protein
VLAVGLAGVACAGGWGSGCTAKKPTELVPGVFTQVAVPRNIAQVSVWVKGNGQTKFCQAYDASNGVVLLPETLGVIPAESPSETVSVEIRAYDEAGKNSNDAMGCTGVAIGTPPPAGPGPRIIRRSVQTFVDQHVLFLPMPLSYSCFDTDCSTSGPQTCKGAQCVSDQTNPATLVDFDPALVDGTQDCFRSQDCFAVEYPATLVDPATCTYAFPAEAMGQGSGLNVRVLYQDVNWQLNSTTKDYDPILQSTAEQEILDANDTEGFTVLANQQFQLSKGLCSLVRSGVNPPPNPAKGGPGFFHTISAVYASNLCSPKSQLSPICKDQRNTSAATADGGISTEVTCNVPVQLVPAPSAIYMVMDDSAEMNGAFGETGSATAMSLSLAAPVFKSTYVGFQFLKHKVSDCTAAMPTSATPDIDFGLARTKQPAIALSLLGWQAPPSTQDQNLYLQAAMRPEGAYARVRQFKTGLGKDLEVGAVMYFLNRTPVGPSMGLDAGAGDAGGDAGDGGLLATQSLDCDPPLAGGTDPLSAVENLVRSASSGTPSLHTYFVVLDNNQHSPPLPFYNQVATDTGATVLDASQADRNTVLANFANTAIELGTCLYELPPGVDANAKLSFTNPLTPLGPGQTGPIDFPIPYAAGCAANAPSTVDGWAIDNGRIRVCGTQPPSASAPAGQSCFRLRAAVLSATAASLQAQDAGAVSIDGGVNVPDVPVHATMPCVTKM